MKNKIKKGLVAVAVALLLSSSTMSFDFETIRFANPYDCRSYFECIFGIAFLQACPHLLWYCVELDVCHWRDSGFCDFDNCVGNFSDPWISPPRIWGLPPECPWTE